MGVSTAQTHREVSLDYRTRQIIAKVGWYFLVCLAVLVILVPLWIAIVSAFEPNTYIPSQQIRFWPIHSDWSWHNLVLAWTTGGLGRGYAITLLISVLTMIPTLFVSSLIGYVFATKQFWGKEVVFLLFLMSMMMPGQVTLIPNFIVYRYLGFINTIIPLVFPGGLINVFGIFLIRSFMQNLPKELLDAAEIDGAGPFYTFWRIVIPLSLPALATLTIISFTGVWNDYFAPLIFLNSNSLYTIQLHVAEMVTPFSGTTFAGTLQQAADFIAAAPIVVLFLLLQPYFIEGITVTGLQ